MGNQRHHISDWCGMLHGLLGSQHSKTPGATSPPHAPRGTRHMRGAPCIRDCDRGCRLAARGDAWLCVPALVSDSSPQPVPHPQGALGWSRVMHRLHLVTCFTRVERVPEGDTAGGETWLWTVPFLAAQGDATRLATSVCRLRRDRMGQGPTVPHAGRSTFLLSSGGAGGRVLLRGF